MLRLMHKVRNLYELMQVFTSLRDVNLYRAIRDGHYGEPLASLRLRGMGNRVLVVRPDSTDINVLMSTFVDRFHLAQVPPIPLDGTIVDLGAYTGMTTAQFAYLHPGARILAVEMDRENYELAQRNTRSFGPRCRVIRAAMWNEVGEISFQGDRAWGYHVVHDRAVPADERRRVASLTLERLLDDHGIERVDFLKMDIEGAEFAVFETAERWIERVAAMNLECHPNNDPRASVDYFRGVLEKHGFRCEIDPRHELSLTAIHHERCHAPIGAACALEHAAGRA